MDDNQIVILYWQRNEQAIEHTRAKYGRYCRTIALGILEDPLDAQECKNDTYLAAWNAIPPHRPQALSGFLGKITRRIALDRYRANTAEKRGGHTVPLSLEELAECIPAGQSFQEALQARELAQSISSFLRKLPQTERNLFIRRYWYCDSVSQICTRFSFGESKVKTTLMRTRAKLRKHLRKDGVFCEEE